MRNFKPFSYEKAIKNKTGKLSYFNELVQKINTHIEVASKEKQEDYTIRIMLDCWIETAWQLQEIYEAEGYDFFCKDREGIIEIIIRW